MADYRLQWSKLIRKDFDRLPSAIADRIYKRIGSLSASPRPSASLKLKGGSGLWRLRVGDYRVLYAIDDATKLVTVLGVAHRKDVYRDL